MSKQIQLSIPKPCHENWDAMTPVQKGKFCGSCQKQVVDFSNMSDRQVTEFFKKPTTGSVCGRFMTDQLERSIEIPKKRIPWLKYFFQFVIPAFLVSIKASAQTVKGRIKTNTVAADTATRPFPMKLGMVSRPINTKLPLMNTVIKPVEDPILLTGDIKVTKDTAIKPIECTRTMGIIAYRPEPIKVEKITGKVVDDKGNPLTNATIIIKGTTTGVVTRADGSFSITPLAGWKNITLVGSFAGYELTELLVDKKTSSDPVTIQLRPVPSMMVGELVVCRKPVIKKEIRRVPLMPVTREDKHAAAFKIFPNPVVSGSSLNIEIKKMEEGYYSLQVLNLSGQPVHQQEIWIDAEARLLNINVPPVAAGNYLLVLLNKSAGKRFTQKLVIQ